MTEISYLCLQRYEKLPHSCRSTDRGVVLAGIALKNAVDNSFELLSLGAGVKCMPHTKISKHGDILHDSHAEILCRRGLLRVLYDEVEKYKQGKGIFHKPGDLLELKAGLSLHMYISQAPCGDASIVQLSKTVKGKEPTSGPDEFKALNGRLHFSELNRVRTKPGRIDAIPTRSMSCSDKISRWNALGVQGGLLSNLVKPIFIESYTIGHFYDEKELRRSLVERIPEELRPNNVKFIASPVDFRDGLHRREKPSAVSFNWNCVDDAVEICVDGKRQGSGKRKRDDALPAKVQSRLSKQNLYRLYNKSCAYNFDEYQKRKLLNKDYSRRRQKFFESDAFSKWQQSFENFECSENS